MDYANGYYDAANAAQRIRDEAAKGKVADVTRGLGAKDTVEISTQDFADIRAKYMNIVQDMFKPLVEETQSYLDAPTSSPTPERNPKLFSEAVKGGTLPDRDLLALTLQAEAGGEGAVGMLAAGSVIANRVNSGKYGNSIADVILAPGQFSAWNFATGYAGGEGGVDMTKLKASKTAYAVADQILSGKYESPVGGATHYYNPEIATPDWGQEAGGEWTTVGHHVFGYGN